MIFIGEFDVIFIGEFDVIFIGIFIGASAVSAAALCLVMN